jgi:IS30 family transposase
MKQRPRIYYSQSQIAQMWNRWQEGVSLNEIGRMFDRGHSSVQRILSETGGIRPPQRRRSRRGFSLAEREEISRGIAVAKRLNDRPRKTLGCYSPAEKFYECVATTD